MDIEHLFVAWIEKQRLKRMRRIQSSQADELFRLVVYRDDREAFRTLFFQFYSPLCVFAGRYIPDSAMVCEDVVQDVFVRMWERRGSLVAVSSFRNFVVTMVRNACIDHLRRQRQEHSWQQWRLQADSADAVGDIYSADELRALLDEALARLPDSVREAFVMSRFDGKKYAEIAQLQQVSVKTVEAHIGKALRFLRTELRDYLPAAALLALLNGAS